MALLFLLIIKPPVRHGTEVSAFILQHTIACVVHAYSIAVS